MNYIRRYDNKKPVKKDEAIYNESIRAKEVLVITDEGKKGPIPTKEALKMAYDQELDLVLVAPTAKPPVAKILDYSKYRYEQQKKKKEMQKKQRESVVVTKEVRLSPVIDIGDFNVRLKNAKKFISKGEKVKVSIRFRGRMITHKEVGMKVMNDFIEQISDVADVESRPKMDGRSMFMLLTPTKDK